jgi:hypothetical protein
MRSPALRSSHIRIRRKWSHVEDGGGDARGFEQKTGQWLVRDQLKIPQVESGNLGLIQTVPFCLSLMQDWKFGVIAPQVRRMESGRSRDKAIEEFWISVDDGSQYYETEFLRMKGWDLDECLHLIDETHVESSSRVSTPVGMSFWRLWKHKSSVVLGMGGLAPQ